MYSLTLNHTLVLTLCLLSIATASVTDRLDEQNKEARQRKVPNITATKNTFDFLFPDSPALNMLNSLYNATNNGTSDEDYDDDKIGGNAITTILG